MTSAKKKLAYDSCKIKLNPLCHCYQAVSEFDLSGIHCSVTHKGQRPLTNEQGGEQQSHAAPQKHPALLPHLHSELRLYRAILTSFISAITTTQYIIRTAWAKPTALHKTTATLKHYVTGMAQAFEDSPETGYRKLHSTVKKSTLFVLSNNTEPQWTLAAKGYTEVSPVCIFSKENYISPNKEF